MCFSVKIFSFYKRSLFTRFSWKDLLVSQFLRKFGLNHMVALLPVVNLFMSYFKSCFYSS